MTAPSLPHATAPEGGMAFDDPAAIAHADRSHRALLAHVDLVVDRLDGAARWRRLARTVAGALLAAAAVLPVLLATTAWLRRADDARLIVACVVAAACAGAWHGWRRSPKPRLYREAGALWLEQARPAARFAFVTLVEPEAPAWAPETRARLLAQAGAAPWPLPPSAAASRGWRAPALVALLAGVAALLLGDVLRVRAFVTGDDAMLGAPRAPADTRIAARPLDPLARWRVVVTPPAYVGGVPRVADDPREVRALVGSDVRLEGPGDAAEVRALTAALLPTARALRVTPRDDGWTVRLDVPVTPVAVRVAADRADGTRANRLLAIVPIPDSLPVVRLDAPARDTVFATATGTLVVAGEARDDHALVALDAEFIVTTGSGERYAARTLRLPHPVARRRTARLADTLRLDTLGLAAGDVVHLRLVARDARPGDGRGASETRTLRIARADEADSVAVEPAPPPETERSLLSQRMLLRETERLVARMPALARETVVREARGIGRDQAALRRAVSGLLFQRLSGDGESEHAHYEGDGHDHGFTFESGRVVPTQPPPAMPGATPPSGLPPAMDFAEGESPVVAINRPLLEAYNAMWDAGRALEGGDPAAAIAPMQAALDAIQRARAAERVYLRGRPPAVVIDLARVRLSGRDTGQDARRTRTVAPDDRAVRRERSLLRAAVALASPDATIARAARDSLVLLRLDALADAPAFAGALATLLDRVGDGGDVTDAVVAARRALAPPRRGEARATWGVP